MGKEEAETWREAEGGQAPAEEGRLEEDGGEGWPQPSRGQSQSVLPALFLRCEMKVEEKEELKCRGKARGADEGSGCRGATESKFAPRALRLLLATSGDRRPKRRVSRMEAEEGGEYIKM
jgi:hypothetical protein